MDIYKGYNIRLISLCIHSWIDVLIDYVSIRSSKIWQRWLKQSCDGTTENDNWNFKPSPSAIATYGNGPKSSLYNIDVGI